MKLGGRSDAPVPTPGSLVIVAAVPDAVPGGEAPARSPREYPAAPHGCTGAHGEATDREGPFLWHFDYPSGASGPMCSFRAGVPPHQPWRAFPCSVSGGSDECVENVTGVTLIRQPFRTVCLDLFELSERVSVLAHLGVGVGDVQEVSVAVVAGWPHPCHGDALRHSQHHVRTVGHQCILGGLDLDCGGPNMRRKSFSGVYSRPSITAAAMASLMALSASVDRPFRIAAAEARNNSQPHVLNSAGVARDIRGSVRSAHVTARPNASFNSP